MENNNNNTVNILTFDVNTGSIGMDQQLFSLLSQIIIQDRQEAAERRRNSERRETAREEYEVELQKLQLKREEMELERIKFQLEKEKFFFELEKAERLSNSKKENNNFNK